MPDLSDVTPTPQNNYLSDSNGFVSGGSDLENLRGSQQWQSSHLKIYKQQHQLKKKIIMIQHILLVFQEQKILDGN